ncbi:purine-nucleoside phosphorylase [Propioniciclava coleopterorum]|uniref:Uridine phosphorylase n=1 Tax=Propioniciclava coleopterorum TaxID=2714937 RepID=A0A6G7Y2J9_9ACTN|nr:purine-nucleoside phosphorylase [Propioniciclava coleopterorum]QIK71104.1 purine-nucleoside phosphorylase [Propioniciclava coleopterorum]
MPTPHISAEPGQIAPLMMMPGDPKRAARIAQEYLDDVELVSDVRGIGCWTGTYQGTPMSVMASGMGVPSTSIYATELFRFYGVERIIRVGTCGGMHPKVKVGDTVIATAAHTNASISTLLVPGINLSWASSYPLLRGAMDAAAGLTDAGIHAGPVYTSDLFYLARPEIISGLVALGTLGVEMESAALFAAAQQEGAEALTVLTVSDHLTDGSVDMTAEERETLYATAVKIAAAALLS